MSATPRPWVYAYADPGSDYEYPPHDVIVYEDDMTEPVCQIIAMNDEDERDGRLAKMIVHRVNTYEKLVEALERVQKMCQEMGIDVPDCETCQRRFPTNTDCKLCAAVKLTKEKP